MSGMNRHGAVILLCTLSLIASGCGRRENGPAKFIVTGVVTMDHQPLETGSILFVDPSGQTQSNFASIKQGTYQTELEQGNWNVQITANRELKDKMVPDAAGTGMVPAAEQYIPARYNQKTELQIDVKPVAKQDFPFPLKSK